MAHWTLLQQFWGVVPASNGANVWQVLSARQAIKLAQPTGTYQDAVMALCAKAAENWPGRQGSQSLCGVAAYKAFSMTDLACPLVPPAIIAALLFRIALVLS